ncbi:MAG: tRNA epoxyqueuosine(34) reductase QueG, partial [Deltaproteobacteria bacterium]|nr:tRNA epoxyqueuosine(34) reductase QueG [Deltaproteobacteria bacterium]MBW2534583.1 tRNA epoxyqueuosine(34) reductase QueG [Deltaproteobacteria bacterium]
MSAAQDRLATELRAAARELGFDAVGFAPAGDLPPVHHQRYVEFIRRGMHGDMSYLARHAAARRRVDGPEILAGAETVVCVALRYGPRTANEERPAGLARWIARYARGRDYHEVMGERLAALVATIERLAPGERARPLCDTAPVLERAWAARAGLGFVGKNGMLIVPGVGSLVVLGEVVTTLRLTASTLGPVPGCGDCDACLQACPSGALVEPYVLEPRRCLSYQTIECRTEPTPEQAAAVTEQLFGCDRCQLACPHNAATAGAGPPDDAFRPLRRWQGVDLPDLLDLDRAGWRALSRGTALSRLELGALQRNAVVLAAAAARRGDPAASQLLAVAAR